MKRMFIIILASALIFIIVILGIGYLNFNTSVKKEINALLTSKIISENRNAFRNLESIPLLLQNYIKKVNVTEKPSYYNITLKQKGKIRSYPKQKWLSFKAIQQMSIEQVGFIWKANSFPMLVRDKFMDGKGEMKINFSGIINIEVATGPKIDQGSLTRYLGELPLYPIALLDNRIQWEVIDNNSLKATIHVKNVIADGIFYFDENGLISSFKTKRYMLGSLNDFTGTFQNYKNIDGLLIPTELTAIWNLDDEDYPYFKCKVVHYELK